MVSPGQQRVQQVSQQFILGYLRQKERADEIVGEVESLEYLQALAESDPELAKSLEGLTFEERESRKELLCLSIGVAHAILYVLDE